MLWQLLEHGSLSRGELAERTGLSAVTINAITKDLEQQRYVMEIRKTEGAAGRPAGILDLHPQLGTLIGIDCQPTDLWVLSSDVRGERQQRQRLQAEQLPDLQRQLLNAVDQLLRAPPFGPVRQVTVSFPAPVAEEGALLEPNSLPQFDLAPLQARVTQAGAAFVVENDANLRALGEKHHGAATDHDNFMVLVQRRSGIGLGLYLDGAIYRGSDGRAGELALARWPYRRTPTFVEQLPTLPRQEALTYLVAAIAAALDLHLVIVTDDASGDHRLDRRLQQVAPQLQVVPSPLDESGSALGALAASRLRYAQTMLATGPAPAPPAAPRPAARPTLPPAPLRRLS
ncbi:ROK family transcriptional regulator [Deinococcus sonorensis]|uniref:ROK family transcriptional regulator n=1 Tax=Deinococcus sonorensis KR-87 TaxID=694439 RepID=A0AAU7UCR4_9DEIO